MINILKLNSVKFPTKQKDMTTKEIINALKEGGNFSFRKKGEFWVGHGAINNFPECNFNNTPHLTNAQYSYLHYPKKKQILESIPWTQIVENPRMPKEGEYPTEDGEYITMLDADEHAILINTFRNGHWCLYNETHVKWWMPFTKEMEEYANENSNETKNS